MTAIQKPQFSAIGDPNGTRTRVFAVKGYFPFKSTASPAFHDLFRAIDINGLQGRGDGMNSIQADLLGAESLERAALRYSGRMRAAYLATAKYLRNRAARGIEAASAATTTEIGVVHESPVAESDAPKSQ